MENELILLKKDEKKKPSVVENLGKIGIEIGSKLGKVATEFFTGKQPTKEEKELNAIRKERKFKLKLIQEDAQYQKDLEAAERGEYVPPAPVVKDVKKTKNISGMFDNIGKYNPLKDFEQTKSIGTTDFGIGGVGSRTSVKQPDFGLEGFVGSVNPMETKKRRN